MSETSEVWVNFQGRIEKEDDQGAVLVTEGDSTTTRIRFKKGDYRKNEGRIEVRIGAEAEWFHPPLICQA